MQIKTIFAFIASFVIFPFTISGETLPRLVRIQELFTPGEIRLLKSGEILTYARMEGKGEVYTGSTAPSLPRGAGYIYDYLSGYSVVSVEKLFFKGTPGDAGRITQKLTDYTALKGMKYHSLSEGRESTLIIDSYISGENRKNREKDGELIFAFFTIKDNRLGTIPFRGETWHGNGIVTSRSVNYGPVSRLGMKIFEPGDYRVYKYFIYDRPAGGWFYCSIQLMRVRIDIMKSLDLLKPENICNRLRGETVHILGLIGYSRSGELAAFR